MGFFSSLINGLMTSSQPAYAIVDTETTGFSVRRDRIVEIGVVIVDQQFRECGRWGSLINPEKAITNSAIHGITDAMVAQAPTFKQIFSEFASTVHGLHLMAHNSPYDAKMLCAEIDRFGAELEGDVVLPFIDTIDLAKQLTTGPYNLESLARRCGVFNPNAHAAVDDAATTAAVMREIGGEKFAETIDEQGIRFDARLVATWHLESRPAVPR